MNCHRCNGQMRYATDEHGEDDTHCIQCGARRPAPAFVAASVLADLASENRQRSARRSLAGKKGAPGAA